MISMLNSDFGIVVHLFNDEKFVDSAIEHFENGKSNRNLYLIFVENLSNALIHVKTTNNVVKVNRFNLIDQLKSLQNYNIKAVFIHYLDSEKCKLTTHLKKSHTFNVVWFFWGADGFSLQKFRKNLYQSKTVNVKFTGGRKLKNLAHQFIVQLERLGIFILDSFPGNRELIDLIKYDIDYIVPVILEDYEMFKRFYSTRAEAIQWNYLSIEQMLSENIEKRVVGKNILLGNSATKTNNHIEVIDYLSDLKLEDRKVYVPLNYGDSRYREFVINYGRKKLGVNFFPLIDFLSLKEYNKILLSCSLVIMNHNRQQAMGNIISTIWMGASLYINGKSTVYQYLSRIGVKVNTIDQLKQNISINTAQTDELLLSNRTNLYNEWGKIMIDERTNTLFNKVYKN